MQLLLSSSPNWYLSHVVAATEDGSVVAYAGHLSVTVLDTQQQQFRRCLWPQRIRVSCVAFAAGDTLLVAGYEDGSARCFDWQTGLCVCLRAAAKAKRRQSSSELTAVVAPSWLDHAAVFADAGGRLLLWPFTAAADSSGSKSSSSSKYTVLLESVGSKVVCLAAAPASSTPHSTQQLQQVCVGCQDGRCVLFDVAAACQLVVWRAHDAAAVHSLAWKAADTDSKQQQQQQYGQHGFLVSVGADRRVKVWAVPAVSAAAGNNTSQQAPAAAAAAAAHTPDSAAAAAEGPQASSATDAAATADTGTSTAADTTAAAAPPAAAAAPKQQPPAVLQLRLQPLSVAAVDFSPPGGGPKAQQYYGAAAVLPGSVCVDGSCVVLAAGVNGRLGAAAMVAGRLDCQWAALPKSPHTGGIFQLQLQPAGASKQQQQQQQQQGEVSRLQAGSPSAEEPQQQQQQDLAQQSPLGPQQQDQQQLLSTDQQQQLAVAGDYQVLSVSMDRCFALSKLTVQLPPPPPATAAPAAATAGSAAGNSKSSVDKRVLLLPLPHTPLLTSSSSSSSTDATALQLRGCSPQWVCQGLGGFAYSCAVQPTFPDGLLGFPQYSKVRVAVGCGDKTIRVATLGVRTAPAQQQQQQQQQEEEGEECSSLAATSILNPVDSTADSAAAGADNVTACAAASSSSSAHGSDGCTGAAVQVECCELQLPVPKPTLLWRNIQDRVQAMAWHPTNPRVFAFGCHDGSLGVCDFNSAQLSLYSRRHGGPVTHIAWQQQQQQQGRDGALMLLSLGGEGCLLLWPAISPSNSSSSNSTQPLDVGAQLQGLLVAASAAGGGQEGGSGAPGWREFVHWSCMALSGCGGWLAVCCTKGQLLLLSGSSSSGSGGGGRTSSSSGGSWRRGVGPSGGVFAPWQLSATCSTPAARPIKAAAWQPQQQPHRSVFAAAAAAAGGGGSGEGAAGYAGVQSETGATAGPLLAAVDEHTLYLFASSSSSSVAAQGGSAAAANSCLVASCSVQDATHHHQQQQQQQQLLSLAWSGPDVVCVGCSDGSIQVVQVLVRGHPHQQAASCQCQLLPLHSLRGHTGPVLCVSGLPGWPGLLLSGSQDQTLRCWQPLLEPAATPAALQAAAAAATSSADGAAAGEGSLQQQEPTAITQAVGPPGMQPQQPTSPTAAVPKVPKAKPRKLFICPKAKPFLPELPDTASHPHLQQQACLDVVALAEALYPPVPAGTAAPPSAAAPAADGAGCRGGASNVSMGLDAGVLALLGLPAEAAGALDTAGSGGTDGLQQQQGLEQQAGLLRVAEAFRQQLSGVVGGDYTLGSWLPVMTADVPELLHQHSAWTVQQQQQQQQQQGAKQVAGSSSGRPTVGGGVLSGSVGGLSASQVGMLRFVAGDVRGFLAAAAAADCLTPDVVALAAAGGAPAFAAAARLAAAKLAGGG